MTRLSQEPTAGYAAQADGSILIAGRLATFNGVPCGHIARIGSDGAVNGTFNPGGAGADDTVYSVLAP